MPWPEHYLKLDQLWEPGQHTSIIVPNGMGKDYLITRGLLPLWLGYKVLYIDIKKADPTLAGFGRLVHQFPSFWERAGRRPHWFRLHVNSALGGVGMDRQRWIIYDALKQAAREGGWLVVIGEISYVANHLHLGQVLRDIWIRMRNEITLVGATQAPRWAPGELYDQPARVYLGPIRDSASRKRLIEIGGNTDIIKAVMPTLEKFDFLYIDTRDAADTDIAIVRVPAGLPIMPRAA